MVDLLRGPRLPGHAGQCRAALAPGRPPVRRTGAARALIARGFGWLIDVRPPLTTPIVGGRPTATVIDLEQPELAINCPAGYGMIPLRIARRNASSAYKPPTATKSEILIGRGPHADPKPAGHVPPPKVPMNLRTEHPRPPAPFTLLFGLQPPTAWPLRWSARLARKQRPHRRPGGPRPTVNVYQFDLVYEPLHPPILIGPRPFRLLLSPATIARKRFHPGHGVGDSSLPLDGALS